MQKNKILAVIGARGGSKGVPRKNIRNLGGKPLLAWTIEAAKGSKRLDRIVLSTDDDEIAAIGAQFGVDAPFKRPPELATDTSNPPDAVIHMIENLASQMNEAYDVVVWLQPTAPFRKAEHIDTAIEKFLSAGADSLLTLRRQDYPPWWMFRLEDDRIRTNFEYHPAVNVFDMERQQFPPLYRPNGAVYVTWVREILAHRRLVNPENSAYHVMSDNDSVDIDTPADFARAEALLASGKS